MKQYQYQNELIIARKYIDEGNVKRGKSHMEKVYTFAPELMDEDDFVDLALIYDELNDFELGIQVYETMLSFYEHDCQAYYGLGMLYENLEQFEVALDYYQKSIEADSTYYEAYFFMAGIYDELGKEEEAIKAYRQALDINENSFWANLNLGSIFESKNMNLEAKELFEKAFFVEEHYLACFNLGVVYNKLGDVEDSISWYQQSIELKRDYGYAYLNLSVIYKERQDYIKGIIVLSEGIEQVPETSYLYYHRACHYQLIDDIEKSKEDLTMALKLYNGFHEFIKKDKELLPIYNSLNKIE